MKIKYINGEKSFHVMAYIIVGILAIISLLPFALIVIASLTEENSLIQYGYSFFPREWSLSAYTYLMAQASTIFRAYGISLFVTILGTLLSVLLTAMVAYPLSRQDFKYKNVISFFIFFTMLFNGGVVPSYIMWTQGFHLSNTIWALILPNYLVTAFNVFLARNYYSMNIPSALIESAQIDGAKEFHIFARIILPLSKPVIATIGMFTAVIYWNDWINSIYYINNPKLYSIQYYLMQLMQNIQFLQSGTVGTNAGAAASIQMPSTSIRMALAVIGVIPILIIFPFIQKHLVKGVVMGAVKG